MTFGHEFTGIVEEIGPTVQNLKVGDHVLVPFNIFCGSCFFCQRELYGNCQNTNAESTAVGAIYGYSHTAGGYDGGQAEFVRVPMADVGPTVIPRDLDLDDAVLLTDAYPTGYQAAEMGEIKEVDDMAIHIKKMTDWLGADVYIDAVGCEAAGSAMQSLTGIKMKMQAGSATALHWAINSVRKGGVVSIVGVYGHSRTTAVSYQSFPFQRTPRFPASDRHQCASLVRKNRTIEPRSFRLPSCPCRSQNGFRLFPKFPDPPRPFCSKGGRL